MSNKVFLAVIGVMLAGLVALFVFGGSSGDNTANELTKEEVLAISEADYVSGQTNDEKVQATLIEYGDFACPGCGSLHPILKQVKAEYGDNVRFVFRHFPLTQLHPNAMIAHRSAEAAGKQGKFYEMHDLLYERQAQWVAQGGSDTSQAQSVIRSFAQEIGLDMEQFDQDYNDSATLTAINEEANRGEAIGVSSTPTVFIDGEEVQIRSIDDLRSALDIAIQEN